MRPMYVRPGSMVRPLTLQDSLLDWWNTTDPRGKVAIMAVPLAFFGLLGAALVLGSRRRQD